MGKSDKCDEADARNKKKEAIKEFAETVIEEKAKKRKKQ